MRKNISEKLTLDMIDGSDLKDKLEQEKEDSFNQTQKTLDKAEKLIKPLSEQLILEEFDDDITTEELNYSNIFSSLIKSEWDAIEQYNSILALLNGDKTTTDVEDAKNIISDIVKEEYIHVGQLEKLSQIYNSTANNISDGHTEATEQIGE